MKIILGSRRHRYVAGVSIFLTTVALIIGMVGCDAPSTGVQIRDWYDLDDVRDDLDGQFILMNDLDSTTAGYTEVASPTANEGKGWLPIGIWPDPFVGSFDGQGFEIRDLFIDREGEDNVGLFSFVDTGGIIVGVALIDAAVTGEVYVGGLVGHNHDGSLSNCHSTGNVAGDMQVGGLVGINEGTVSNSYSTATVTGGEAVGGLVGLNGGTVSNSYSTGSVTGNSSVGGLVGWNDEGTVDNSFWDTETSGQATSDGGTGKNTTAMQDITTFSGATWDIIAVANPGTRNPSYIWNIVDDETYPFLSWHPAA
jgi:hypothetical protein